MTPLRLARLEKGLSQWDVAKQTGISQTMISLYEREYVEPNDLYKAKLAKLYGNKAQELWKS
jgi:transcriptional regulator with XRE-family HTH domain